MTYEVRYSVQGHDGHVVLAKSESIAELEDTLDTVRAKVGQVPGYRVQEPIDDFEVTVQVQTEEDGWVEVSSYQIVAVDWPTGTATVEESEGGDLDG